jgi:hypothetical protein
MNYGVTLSGKEGRCDYKGRSVRWFNQSSLEWTHPYEYENNGSNLHNAGCGIFSMAVVIQQLCGEEVDVEWLADYSVACGGRGDDGTDRPELLAGLARGGLDEKFGFRYDGDGLVNDHEKLWQLLKSGGFAMCNLRVGHIVAVIDWRERDGERQMLVVDSACESNDRRVRDRVREVVPDSESVNIVRNRDGIDVGLSIGYSIYWVPVDMAMDFNLIWKR